MFHGKSLYAQNGQGEMIPLSVFVALLLRGMSISGARVAPSTGKAVGAFPSRGRSRWISTGAASQAEDPGCKPGGECQAAPGLGSRATGVSPWVSTS